MSKKVKIILGVLASLFIAFFGFIVFGFYLMADEDRYGDLVYFHQKVEDGDIIFRCKFTAELGQTTKYNEFRIIEKSWGNVYVWDNQITIKEDLYNWAEKGNGERVKVFRIKNSNFDLKNLKLKNGAYNDLIISDKIELVIENF